MKTSCYSRAGLMISVVTLFFFPGTVLPVFSQQTEAECFPEVVALFIEKYSLGDVAGAAAAFDQPGIFQDLSPACRQSLSETTGCYLEHMKSAQDFLSSEKFKESRYSFEAASICSGIPGALSEFARGQMGNVDASYIKRLEEIRDSLRSSNAVAEKWLRAGELAFISIMESERDNADDALSLAYHANGLDDSIRVVKRALGEAVFKKFQLRLGDHKNGVKIGRFLPDGARLYTVASGEPIRLWDIYGQPLGLLAKEGKNFFDAVHSPDEKYLLTLSTDSIPVLWDLQDGELIYEYSRFSSDIMAAGYSPDSRKLAVCSRNGQLQIFDFQKMKISHSAHGQHKAPVTKIVVPEYPGFFLTKSAKEIVIWDWNGNNLKAIDSGEQIISSVKTGGPDNDWVLYAATDGVAYLYDEDRLLRKFGDRESPLHQAAFSHDGSKVLTCHRDGSAVIWDAISGDQLLELDQHQGAVKGGSFSPNDSLVITYGLDKEVLLWDAYRGEVIKTVDHHSSHILKADFLPLGSLFLTASQEVDGDNSIKLWDYDGNLMLNVEAAQGWHNSISFSYTSDHLLICGENGEALLGVTPGFFLKKMTFDKVRLQNSPRKSSGAMIFSGCGKTDED